MESSEPEPESTNENEERPDPGLPEGPTGVPAADDEPDVNESHPNEQDLDEAADEATNGAEGSDVSGAPATGVEHEDLEPLDEPDEDAAGE